MTGLRVLSLFDGISCGQIALERAGVPVEVYYSSEIEKPSIQITQYNYPNTIQLGDVTKIDFNSLKGKVDLIIGGSPCQNLSIIGNRKGLQGEQSGLFYKYVEALETIQPKYFLLENNYGMAMDALEEMSSLMKIHPVLIDSARVSAQRRRRYYWTNIGPKRRALFGMPYSAIPQPEDKGYILESVLDENVEGAYVRTGYLDKRIKMIADKLGYCPLIWNAYDGVELNPKGKGPTQTTNCGSRSTSASIIQFKPCEGENLYEVKNGKITLSDKEYPINLPDGTYGIPSQSVEVCERLQTLPEDYTKYGREEDNIIEISKSSRYKAIGNGWTVDVISHIFSFLKESVDETIKSS
jgi:DNA (cytosine-5)-methyltransferase 3A